MRFISPTKKTRSQGFTLIEVLIIAPIIILAIGGFVALMVAMVGDVLVTRDQSTLSYETQSALDRIEQDAKLSTQFLVTSGTQTAPQGSDSNFTGTAAFSNASNTLIFSTLATTKNPSDTERGLVYYANQPNACGTDQRYNRPMLTKTMYFIKSNSLWRRTVTPDWNTNTTVDSNTVCNGAWQQNSCSPGYSATRCKTNDEKIMDNVASLNTKYYTGPDDTTDIGASAALAASTIDVTINSTKSTAGNDLTDTGTVRVTKLNDIDTTQLPPDVPVVTHSLTNPNTVEFTWPAVSGATTYQVGYKVNSGQWVTQNLGPATTTYSVIADRNDSVSFRVASYNAAGSSAYATDSETIPNWFDFKLENSWEKYGTTYSTPGFTKSKSGRVFLKGMIKSQVAADATSGKLIAKLPEGYRPEGTLPFQVLTSPNAAARIDVKANGDVIIYAGTNTWMSMDNISFLPVDNPYTWKAVSPSNFKGGWTNWNAVGGTYEVMHATNDSVGRVNIQGLTRAGTTTNNTTMISLQEMSSSFIPAKALHFPAGGSGMSLFWVWFDGDLAKRGTQTSSYMGLQALYYPGTVGTWSTPTFVAANNWANYAGNYPLLQCTKASDSVVTIRGLVRNGITTSGTVIATLPAACTPPDKQLITMITSNEDVGRIDIMPDGKLTLRLGNATWVALNLSYIAD